MFTAWGRLVAANARLVAIIAVLALVAAVGAIVTVAPDLSSEGFVSEDAESTQVDETLTSTFDQGSDSIVFLFDADRPVTDPAVQQEVTAALAPLEGDSRFSAVLTTWSTGNPRMIAESGTATYAVAVIAPGADVSPSDVETLSAAISEAGEANDLTVSTGGADALGIAITDGVAQGIVRAESFSVPVTLLIQFVVFGSLIAAGIPLLIAALAIMASLAVIFVLSTDVFQSVFAINIITMLGLGLGIDYSLFMVTRFREELSRRPVAEAITVTMATVGKAILVSGVTVIVGLAATQFFPLPALQSMGQAGIAATAGALLFGLTLLPAILTMLGTRVNRLSIRRNRTVSAGGDESAFWHGIATAVMRYPVQILAVGLIALLFIATPLLRLDLTPGGPEVLPVGSEPRVVSERLAREFVANDADPIPVLLNVANGDATSPDTVTALRDLDDRLTAIPNVQRVESFASPEMATASNFDWTTYGGDATTLPESIAGTIDSTVRGDQILVQVLTNASGADLEQVVRDIRSEPAAGLAITVGGFAAASVDTIDGINAGLLPAAIFVLLGSYLILLLTFGSVLLPLKAIAMTLLSISAALGAVVFIFQDGHLERLFGFAASGEIISTTPILIFCILFGLSMDYEVLMLSRIQEEYRRTGDARAAVATGLARSGRVITGAALIMVVVFGGFMLADIVILKSMGFGLAIAVLIDATIVRGLLVPATMRLLGRWAWWAPSPVRRVVDRLGLGHEEPMPVTAPMGAVAD